MSASWRAISNVNRLSVGRAFSKSANKPPSSGSSAQNVSSSTIKSDVSGLSSNVVLPRSQPLGPGATKDGVYKVPEYFCYDRTSYHEAEIELAKYRCPQPSAIKH